MTVAALFRWIRGVQAPSWLTSWVFWWYVPSGKHTKKLWKITILMGKSTTIFNSYSMLVYRRVNMNTQAVCKTWWNHTKAAEFWCTTNNHQNMGILTRTWGYYHITNQLIEDMTRRWGCKQSSGLLETHCGSMIAMFGVAKLVILLYMGVS